jgi:hypothetical protein
VRKSLLDFRHGTCIVLPDPGPADDLAAAAAGSVRARLIPDPDGARSSAPKAMARRPGLNRHGRPPLAAVRSPGPAGVLLRHEAYQGALWAKLSERISQYSGRGHGDRRH